uniref:Uncharacterized protein n=1 Tax=Ditylenchus dipsaci TaxID=166011 RepID=A0A915EDL8_9BILA
MDACGKRLAKELSQMVTEPPVGVNVKHNEDLRIWTVVVDGASSTLYEGEKLLYSSALMISTRFLLQR